MSGAACPKPSPTFELSPGWLAIGGHLMGAWFRGKSGEKSNTLEAALLVRQLGEAIDSQCRELERRGLSYLGARASVTAFCEAYNDTRRTARGSMWAVHDLGVLRGLQAARHPPRSAVEFVEAVERGTLSEGQLGMAIVELTGNGVKTP